MSTFLAKDLGYDKMVFTMDQRFKDVKVIAWDIDTTLYKTIPELSIKLKNGCIEEISKLKNIPLSEADVLFHKEREKWGSTFLAFMSLGWKNLEAVKKIEEVEKKINKYSYIKYDPELKEVFAKLHSFRHFILRNGTKNSTLKLLNLLGVNPDIFEKMITTEDCLLPKPDLAPFKMLLEITGLPAEQHVYIGDRERVDIEPAKKLGMKTILVWGKSALADISLPTVYDVPSVFL
ncbi:MAG: HAD family hydrolase [Candidatus Gottesmanbacteria bacterium]